MMNMPGFRHGDVCRRVAQVVGNFIDERSLGRVTGNDAGVITARNPDTVRGPDIAYYSFERLPADVVPVGYPSVAPEVVFEVLSPSDHWSDALGKAGEYLRAGVRVVCVVDPETRTATLCRPDAAPLTRGEDQSLELPELHAEFAVPLRAFFG
jgi:Uma2 family endonuclease